MNSNTMICHVDDLVKRYPRLDEIRDDILQAYFVLEKCYSSDGKLLVAGNGGSAADAEHISGELMKRFRRERPIRKELADELVQIDPVRGKQLAVNMEQGLMTIPLVTHEAILTAYMNDVDAVGVYAQQVLGYGRAGDVFLGISTSGNSENVIHAAVMAKAIGMKNVALTGSTGGILSGFADITVAVPERETYKVQELHLPIYHCWCMMLEEYFFGEGHS